MEKPDIFLKRIFSELKMDADCYVYFKFKNRKTGEFTEAYVAVKNVENSDEGLKKFFDLHDYKIVDKRLANQEIYDKWRREKRPVLLKAK